jgi:hypothetical protein
VSVFITSLGTTVLGGSAGELSRSVNSEAFEGGRNAPSKTEVQLAQKLPGGATDIAGIVGTVLIIIFSVWLAYDIARDGYKFYTGVKAIKEAKSEKTT